MNEITVGQNGRIQLPPEALKYIGIRNKTKLYIMQSGDEILISRDKFANIRRLKGCLKSKGGSASEFLLRERKRDTKLMEKKYRRLFPRRAGT